ncbi:monooxygenase [Erythrobacter westpacificensis]|uniref:Monooxygenase n=1 Tax=Erythrobacter westpacificensis TaxID=1055231 RepID=A0ABP9KSG9_9SPHN
MSKKALQIEVEYQLPLGEFKAAMKMAAEAVAVQPGLVWKAWVYDDHEKHASGWYVFDSLETAHAYLQSEVVSSFQAHPAMSNFSPKIFDIDEDASAITRAPLSL